MTQICSDSNERNLFLPSNSPEVGRQSRQIRNSIPGGHPGIRSPFLLLREIHILPIWILLIHNHEEQESVSFSVCHYSMTAAIDNMLMSGYGIVPIKLQSQEQMAGHIWPTGYSLMPLVPEWSLSGWSSIHGLVCGMG